MTCRSVDDLRLRGELSWPRVLSEGVREHFQTCERCRQLQSLWDSPLPGSSVPPEVESRITQRIVDTLSPVSPLPSLALLTTLLLLIAALVITVEALCVGQAGWHALSSRQAAAIFFSLGGALIVMARVVTGQMIPAIRQWLSPALVISLVSLAVMTVIVSFFPYHPDPRFLARGLRCWIIGSSCSLISALCFSLVLRRSAWLSPIRLGAATGFLSGLVGLTVLEIFCPYLQRDHIGVWHFGSAVTCMLLGFLLGAAVGKYRINFGSRIRQ